MTLLNTPPGHARATPSWLPALPPPTPGNRTVSTHDREQSA